MGTYSIYTTSENPEPGPGSGWHFGHPTQPKPHTNWDIAHITITGTLPIFTISCPRVYSITFTQYISWLSSQILSSVWVFSRLYSPFSLAIELRLCLGNPVYLVTTGRSAGLKPSQTHTLSNYSELAIVWLILR